MPDTALVQVAPRIWLRRLLAACARCVRVAGHLEEDFTCGCDCHLVAEAA